MSTSTVKPLMSNNRSKILNNMANNELDVFSQLQRFYPFINEKPESGVVNDFSESVGNWYFARHYVLDLLQFGRFSISPSGKIEVEGYKHFVGLWGEKSTAGPRKHSHCIGRKNEIDM